MKKIIVALCFISSSLHAQEVLKDKVLEWTGSTYGNGFGHKIYSEDPGNLTLLNIAGRHNSAIWSNILSITSQGRVGIGTKQPVAPLTIYNQAGQGHLTLQANDDPSTLSRADLDYQVSGTGHVIGRLASYYLSSGDGGYGGLTLWTRNAGQLQERMRIDQQGNVGIGTSKPVEALQIGSFGNNTSKLSFPGTYNFERFNIGQTSNGNPSIEFVNHTSQSASYGIKIGANIDQYGQGLYIAAAPAAEAYSSLQYGAAPGIFVNTANCVGIGTSNTAGYRLAIAGTMIAERIKVKQQSNWPDYVFNDHYTLPSLQEVEKFIQQNKHLPEMPTAEEVQKNGLDIGEMNRKLLQKVEELTLYIINIEKTMKKDQEEKTILKQQVLDLSGEIQQLKRK
ncbi:MAG TPA: hypothetical protein VM802_26445 [Chitinophaga sp.]|uniref:hypothetical protein n=1 Tax=Chitinophaga sp. TaxID=1869181 RepID=UPI002CC118FD|nr:hypothetical protein [Chitinophaga sp.]HVI48438.1 hypothetical protein [Chitinophaga sp.]